MTRFWHPQSNMSLTDGNEVVFVRGEGSRLWDRDGNTYLDATAGLWYCNVGYGRASIADAIRDQAARLAACSCFDLYASDRTIELADRVAAMAPVDGGRVFFTSGGSESVDTAAKVARRYWSALGADHKNVIISRRGAYHGLNAYGTSLAGIPANREGFGELVREATVIPAFDPRALESEIDRLQGTAAAFIAEPVLGAGGVHPPPPGYLREVARICREREILLALDEVITGFGRLGTLFAAQRYEIRPDILIVAKGLTSGYQPLSAVVFSESVAEPFWREGAPWLRHGYTFSGHATACAAGLANLDILEREGLVARVAEMEDELAAVIGSLAELPWISEVRTVGLLAGVQVSDQAIAADPAFADRVVAEARRAGVITRKLAGDALHISPPFVIERSELERIASILGTAIDHVGRRALGSEVAPQP